jgi:hypothetical protein
LLNLCGRVSQQWLFCLARMRQTTMSTMSDLHSLAQLI